MRLHEALSLTVAKCQKVLSRGLRFPGHLKYCVKEAALIDAVKKQEVLVRHALRHSDMVQKALVYPDLVLRALDSGEYVGQCLACKSAVEPFLHARYSLEKMNVEEGSLYIEGERELVREAVLQANALPGPIIEVGTLWGYTTAWMAQWKNDDKKIVTVDNYCWNPWGISSESHKVFTSRFLEYLIYRCGVEMVDMDKNAFYESYRGPAPSLVFLDANHSYEETLKDIEWARRIGARIIAGHDYCDAFGVTRAVEASGGRCAGAATVWVLNGSDWQQRDEFSLSKAA